MQSSSCADAAPLSSRGSEPARTANDRITHYVLLFRLSIMYIVQLAPPVLVEVESVRITTCFAARCRLITWLGLSTHVLYNV